MPKIIRFPLIMADGYPAKSLEELRAHFDLGKVLEYYHNNNRLLTWLNHRGLEDEAGALRELDGNAPDFQKKLCDIFQVAYEGEIDVEKLEKHLARLNRVKNISDEPEHHRNADLVAFNQEELAELALDEGKTAIYLCQEDGEDVLFTIPGSRRNVTYIGIPCGGKTPKVRVSGGALDKLDEWGIKILSCQVEKPEIPQPDKPEEKPISNSASLHYRNTVRSTQNSPKRKISQKRVSSLVEMLGQYHLVCVSGAVDTRVRSIITQEGFVETRDWIQLPPDLVIVPYDNFHSNTVSQAESRGIPVYTQDEFIAASDKVAENRRVKRISSLVSLLETLGQHPYVCVSGAVDTRVRSIITQEGFVKTRDWVQLPPDLVIVPYDNFHSDTVSQAESRGIPVYTQDEFIAAFD